MTRINGFRASIAAVAAFTCFGGASSEAADSLYLAKADAGSLCAHDNFHAWGVIPFDSVKRDPEQRR